MSEKFSSEGKITLNYDLKKFISGFSILKANPIDALRHINLLHVNERSYYNTLKIEKRRHEYFLGRIAARKAIYQIVSPESSFFVDAGVFKFPIVKGISNIQVSISHSNSITIAIAYPEEHPMGVDIEKIDILNLDSMKMQLMESEINLISYLDLPLLVNYTLLWTIKEALSKVLKTGLTINFRLLEIETIKKTDLHYISTFADFHQYKAISYCTENYVCTIVLPILTKVDFSNIWSSLIEN